MGGDATKRRGGVLPAFAANVLLILVATCWLPLTSLKATMTTEDGTLVQETVRAIPLYQSYQRLVVHRDRHHVRPVLMHWGMAVGISAVVWGVMLRGGRAVKPPERDNA